MSEKDRNEIAGMITNKQIEDLGAPWLAMGAAPSQDFYIPPLAPYVPPKKDDDDSSPLSLEGGGVGSIDNMKRRPSYDWQMRMRYGKSF